MWNSPLARLMRWLTRQLWRLIRYIVLPGRSRTEREERYARVCNPRSEDTGKWPLSMPLYCWNGRDVVTLSDAVCGLQAWGATGSGKSSGIVRLATEAYLRHDFGLLCCTAKMEDPEFFIDLARRCGRDKDVILFGPSHPTTFNFLSEAARGGAGLVANVTTVLMCAAQLALGGKDDGDRESGGFWRKLEYQLIKSSAELLLLADEPLTTVNMEHVVTTLPSCRADVVDKLWTSRSFLFQCLQKADKRCTSPEDREDLRRLADYFLLLIADLGEKTRGTVQTSVASTLDLFNGRLARRLLASAEPTFDFEMLHNGKILIVDMPSLVHGASARLIQMVLKHAFQMCQNRRDVRANARPVGLICDESQLIVDLEHDAKFLTTARGTRTCVCLSTQSISNYLSEHGGAAVEPRVHAMVSNLVCQVFNQTTDTKTIEYAQKLWGKSKTLLMTGSIQGPAQEKWAESALGLGSSSCTAGFNEHTEEILQAGDLQDLAKGGPPDFTVEALVYAGGRPFASTRSPFLPVRFRQVVGSA
jgi:type IV secretory pathway TraG/TraD family ATPase VirD4